MDKKQYRRSNEFDEYFKKLITIENPSMSWMQKNWNLSFQKVKLLFEELQMYNDEVFFHNALYELSFEEEPPTIARIMGNLMSPIFLQKRFLNFIWRISNYG